MQQVPHVVQAEQARHLGVLSELQATAVKRIHVSVRVCALVRLYPSQV